MEELAPASERVKAHTVLSPAIASEEVFSFAGDRLEEVCESSCSASRCCSCAGGLAQCWWGRCASRHCCSCGTSWPCKYWDWRVLVDAALALLMLLKPRFLAERDFAECKLVRAPERFRFF